MQRRFTQLLNGFTAETQIELIVLEEESIWPSQSHPNSDRELIDQINKHIEQSTLEYFLIVAKSFSNFSVLQQACRTILNSRTVEIIVRYESQPFLIFTKNAWTSLGRFNPDLNIDQQAIDLLVRAERQRNLAFIETGSYSLREKVSVKNRNIELDRLDKIQEPVSSSEQHTSTH